MIAQLTAGGRAAAASGPLREDNGVTPIVREAAERSDAAFMEFCGNAAGRAIALGKEESGTSRLTARTELRSAARLGSRRSGDTSLRYLQRGKGRHSQGETTMKTQSKAKVGSTGIGSGESHHVDSSQKFELCRTEETPMRVNGLARVSFDLVPPTHPSITAGVEHLTSFAQFCQLSGIPDPETLLRWLVADRVLIEFGGLVGLVPDVRYVQAGLFLCHVVSCQCCEDDAFVSVSITPKGVMWMLKHYVPTPERHRDSFIPEDLRGPID